MKRLLLIPILALTLGGCASTTVRNDAGVKILSTQANAEHLHFVGGDKPTLVIDGLDHSTATDAGGNTAAKGEC